MKIIVCITVSLLMAACATEPIPRLTGKKTLGHWEAKAQIRDLKREKTSTVSIDFQARDSESLRAEVTGTLGIALASLVVRQEKFQLSIHTQKKFYQGNNSSTSLQTLAGLPIEPGYLISILFDLPLPEKDFECQSNSENLPILCKGIKSDLSIAWRERQGELKRIVIRRPDFEMQILVKNFNTKVQVDPGFYSLTIPTSYKIYQLD